MSAIHGVRLARAGFVSAVTVSVLLGGGRAHAGNGGDFARGGLPGSPSAPAPASAPATAASAAATPAPAAAAPAQAQAHAPDVVLLADGSLFRGTIAELVKDDHVVIVTLVGDTRRFPMADVQYAGRAEDMPAPAESRAPTKRKEQADTGAAPSVAVSFRATNEGTTTLHVWSYVPRTQSPGSTFQTDQSICIAPCETTLPPGTYRFGLSGERGRVEHAPQLFEVFGPVSLEGTYSDRHGTRTAGWFLLGLSAVVGTAVAAVGLSEHKDSLVIGGSLGGLAGIGIGLAIGLQMDKAKVVTVTPPAPGSSEE